MAEITAAVFAAGRGSRMGSDVPKQFMDLGGEPVYMYSLRILCAAPAVTGAVVLVPEEYISQVGKDISAALPGKRIDVIAGGNERNDTLLALIAYLKENGLNKKGGIVLTHDAARPFIDNRIISDNIAAASACGACGTAFPVTDTIFVSDDGKTITDVPERRKLYAAQTPQTFDAGLLCELCDRSSPELLRTFTDACSVLRFYGKEVRLVLGSRLNNKITWPGDIERARQLLNGGNG